MSNTGKKASARTDSPTVPESDNSITESESSLYVGHAPECWPDSHTPEYIPPFPSTPARPAKPLHSPSTPARPAKRHSVVDDSSPTRPAKRLRSVGPEMMELEGHFYRRDLERENLEVHRKILQAILVIQQDIACIARSLQDCKP
jgi:hypothetical protein